MSETEVRPAVIAEKILQARPASSAVPMLEGLFTGLNYKIIEKK